MAAKFRNKTNKILIRLVFSASEMGVRSALGLIAQGLAPLQLRRPDEDTVELVLGEVLNNVVEHAYGPGRTGQIRIKCWLRGQALVFHVCDMGQALPGLALPASGRPGLDCARNELPEGGFGWFLINRLATDLKYARRRRCNFLRFSIPLKRP